MPKSVTNDPLEMKRAYEILVGKVFKKKTYAKIADELGISVKTVYNIRGRPTFQHFLETLLETIDEKEKTRYII